MLAMGEEENLEMQDAECRQTKEHALPLEFDALNES
jgi:hypothetical protein